jgi:hypothetical protein
MWRRWSFHKKKKVSDSEYVNKFIVA